MAGQVLRGVVGLREAAGGDELAAALALLEEVPFAGKGVSADAGLLKALPKPILEGLHHPPPRSGAYVT